MLTNLATECAENYLDSKNNGRREISESRACSCEKEPVKVALNVCWFMCPFVHLLIIWQILTEHLLHARPSSKSWDSRGEQH